MLNSKLKALQEKQKSLDERAECLEVELNLSKQQSERETKIMRENFERLQEHCNSLEHNLKTVTIKANDNEEYSRRNHLRFWGVKLNPKESAAEAIVRVVIKQPLNN